MGKKLPKPFKVNPKLETKDEYLKFKSYVENGGKLYNTKKNKWIYTSYFNKYIYIKDYVNNPYMYHKPFPKQFEVLSSPYEKRLMFSGLGSSKSEILTMKALQVLNTPDASGLLMRSTYSALKLPGNIWDRLLTYLKKSGRYNDFHVNKLDLNIENKLNGAKISTWAARTDYIAEQEKDKLASSEFCFLGYDEIYDSPQGMLFAETRLRVSKDKDHEKCIIWASNPPYRVKKSMWLVDYLNTNNPHPNKLDSFYLIDENTAHYPISFRDNPFIPPEDIINSTKNLSENDKQRLLYGSMVSLPKKGLLINYEELEARVVNSIPDSCVTYIGIDLAGEGRDSTGVSVFNIDSDSNIYITDNILIDTLSLDTDYEDTQLVEFIRYIKNKYDYIEAIIVERSTGGSGQRVIKYIDSLIRDIVGDFCIIAEQPTANKGKFERARLLLYSIKGDDEGRKTYLLDSLEYKIDFMYECITITPIKQDLLASPDLLDSASILYNWLLEFVFLNFEYEIQEL